MSVVVDPRGGKRSGAGRPRKEDEQPSKKMKQEDEMPVEERSLMERLLGTIDTVRQTLKGTIAGDIPQATFSRNILNQLNDGNTVVRESLHQLLVDKKGVRNALVDVKREQLREERKKAKDESIDYQKAIHTKIDTMDNKQLKQLRLFLKAATTHTEFAELTSYKINPSMENEDIICRAFDAMNDMIEERRKSAPTVNNSSQVMDDGDDDSGDEEVDDTASIATTN
jgi:hypothetical protein